MLTKPSPTELSWVDAGGGYQIALKDGKLVCKNDKGKVLASVPKAVAASEAAEQLATLAEWLEGHRRECRDTVEQWMLRSLTVPRAVLEAVWPDAAWRAPLENTVIAIEGSAGFFRGVDPDRGVGVVNLDGETEWWKGTPAVSIPHPILLTGELDDFRQLATELGIQQGLQQLFRETYPRPSAPPGKGVSQFSNGHFQQLNHALGRCRTQGFKVRGGYATCPVWEAGSLTEARYWIGSESPDSPTWTGDLVWVDGQERLLDLAQVGPVAYSEGMRMAAAIYAGRKVEEQ